MAIVGDGPLAASLQLSYGEDDGIVWLGFVADEERRIEILRGADVFILPSLVEGLSLSLLEAMATGLACLATDAGADGEALEGGAGVVLKHSAGAESVAHLATAVLRSPRNVTDAWSKSSTKGDRALHSQSKYY